MNSAMEQLGNAAAGVFERFGQETHIELLLRVPALQERPGGGLSPGPGYRAKPLKTGLQKYTLQESMGGHHFELSRRSPTRNGSSGLRRWRPCPSSCWF
jgi:hypothetical protein